MLSPVSSSLGHALGHRVKGAWHPVWFAALLSLGSAGAQAQSLQALLEAAQGYDAAYLAAKAQ
ncbi:MAG: hypothetical protein ACK4MK_11095, partial [Tepidimonas ignava]